VTGKRLWLYWKEETILQREQGINIGYYAYMKWF